MKKAVIGVAALLALSGCADKLDGTVVDKEYERAYTTSRWMPGTTTCSGNPQKCTTTPGRMVQDYHPACYRVFVSGTVSGDRCINKKRWADLAVGDTYVGEDAR